MFRNRCVPGLIRNLSYRAVKGIPNFSRDENSLGTNMATQTTTTTPTATTTHWLFCSSQYLIFASLHPGTPIRCLRVTKKTVSYDKIKTYSRPDVKPYCRLAWHSSTACKLRGVHRLLSENNNARTIRQFSTGAFGLTKRGTHLISGGGRRHVNNDIFRALVRQEATR